MTSEGETTGHPDEALEAVVEELYGGEAAEFVAQRNRLVAKARKDGDRELATTIAALTKPTRSAAAVNRLVRDDPDAVGDLGELGDQLRAAERDGDAPRMRALGVDRRRLVDRLTGFALELIGVDDPAAALRDEVSTTLTATLADPDVAAQVLSGSLVRPVRWEGFGSVPLGNISALPARSPGAASETRTSTAGRRRSEKAKAPADHSPTKTKRPDAAQERAERERQAAAQAEERVRDAERRRQAELDESRTALDEADAGLEQATDQLGELEDRVRELEAELSKAERDVERARVELRRARTRQREARRVVDKLES